jgi:hypothetical protein
MAWMMAVFDATMKERKRAPHVQPKDFPFVSMKLRNVALAFMFCASVYLIVTGSVDDTFYALAAIGMSLGAIGIWRVTDLVGNHTFETKTLWRKARIKTHWQALGVILFLFALIKIEPYVVALFT